MSKAPSSGSSLDAIERDQRRASDPAASAWVSANAGAGKTHVLKMRVLRLLLAGTEPQRILCLTYTKAAAAEMAARVFADLADWATCPAEALSATLLTLLGHSPDIAETKRARQLFALSVETPGGLKVQTIHAFCEKLLQRFPLEAGVAPGFDILDDALAQELRRDAIDGTLALAVRTPASPLGRALTTVVARAQGDGFDDLVAAAMSDRNWLAAAERLGDSDTGTTHVSSAALDVRYRQALGVRPGVTEDEVLADMAAVLSPSDMRSAAEILSASSSTDQSLAGGLRSALAAPNDRERALALRAVFLTADGSARADARFVTKKVRTADPAIAERLVDARDTYARLASEFTALGVVDASIALVAIVDEILRRYTTAKTMRAALDFNDLVTKSAELLASPDQAQWVLYKLDGGLDHILVDEAQDTSAEQWRVAGALAAEFFAGGAQDDRRRTVFAVGDEKQSIYSFQGAAPDMFRQTGDRFKTEAERARRILERIPLQVSFRTVEPLLRAVDAIFGSRTRTPGVGSAGAEVRHLALRQGHAGLIELWPTEVADEGEESEAFAPLDERAPTSAVVRLAARIADQIATWLETGSRLESADRPIRPGDIIILLRKRAPFAGAMVTALKRRKIPVAGSDRITITEQIAVQDLMSLGDVLLLPEDDLALAVVLKSPLIGLDDNDLMRLAPERKGSLWQALLDASKSEPRYRLVADCLKRWRARADFLPPLEFFADLLDNEGARTRLLERLGPDAADPLDEFVSLALDYDEANPPSLQGFLDWLRAGRREIKRDLEHGRDQVRVMTVHGAKGLEAPIVFLPDTCSATGGRASPIVTLDHIETRPFEAPLNVWAIKGAKDLDTVATAREAARQRTREESDRLLYVALTRARDRLYISGFEGGKSRPKDCWYETIKIGLDGLLERAITETGLAVERLSTPQTAAPDKPRATRDGVVEPRPRPDWASRPAPRERGISMPMAPSRLAPLDTDDDGEPVEPSTTAVTGAAPTEPRIASPHLLTDQGRFLRGTLTHALLEHLPTLPLQGRETAAGTFLRLRAPEMSPRQRASIAHEAMVVLEDPRFAPAFGPGSRAEVSIAAEVPRPTGVGLPLRVAGQIDRLVELEHEFVIVDFKTNRPPPDRVEDVAMAYILQLAAYRLAIAQAFPGKSVRAALIWTDGPRLMPVPDALLLAGEQELWAMVDGRAGNRPAG